MFVLLRIINMNTYNLKTLFLLKRWLPVCLFLITAGIPSTIMAGTFEGNQLYVALGGDDSVSRANNDINTPWLTIDKAMQSAEAGDVVNFREGTYNSDVEIRTHNTANEGTALNRIVFTNYADEVVLWNDTGGRIYIDRKYWTISGINLKTGNNLIFVGKDTDGDYFIYEDGTATLTGEGGSSNYAPITLQTAGSYNVIIRNNTFIGPGAGLNENTAGLFV